MGLFGNRIPRDARNFIEKTKGTQLMFPNTWALVSGAKPLSEGLPEGSGKLHLLDDGTGFLWKINSAGSMEQLPSEIQISTISSWGDLKACPTYKWMDQFPSDVKDFLFFRAGPWDFAILANSNWHSEEVQGVYSFGDWMKIHHPSIEKITA